jgi:hypothetical protein
MVSGKAMRSADRNSLTSIRKALIDAEAQITAGRTCHTYVVEAGKKMRSTGRKSQQLIAWVKGKNQ